MHKGTAVYVYCILDNDPPSAYTTFTNLTFSIDGSQVGSFSYNLTGSGVFLYNMLVYSNSAISDDDHTFVIHSPTGGAAALLLFDYAQYT